MEQRYEIERRTGEMLAALPPHSWMETARRLTVVRRYLASEDRSTEKARLAAIEIGLTLSMFYRLARIWRRTEVRTSRLGWSPMSDALERIVKDAVGTGTTSVEQVLRTANALADSAGLGRPTRGAVRSRYVNLLAGRRMRERMDVEADLLLDRAVLGFDARDGDTVGSATLTCLFDLSDGSVRAHALTAGDAEAVELLALLEAAAPGSRVAVSQTDPVIGDRSVRELIVHAGRLPVLGRWRIGGAHRASFGLRIGRVRVLEHAPSRTKGGPVDIEVAKAVVDELLRRHREDTASPSD